MFSKILAFLRPKSLSQKSYQTVFSSKEFTVYLKDDSEFTMNIKDGLENSLYVRDSISYEAL